MHPYYGIDQPLSSPVQLETVEEEESSQAYPSANSVNQGDQQVGLTHDNTIISDYQGGYAFSLLPSAQSAFVTDVPGIQYPQTAMPLNNISHQRNTPNNSSSPQHWMSSGYFPQGSMHNSNLSSGPKFGFNLSTSSASANGLSHSLPKPNTLPNLYNIPTHFTQSSTSAVTVQFPTPLYSSCYSVSGGTIESPQYSMANHSQAWKHMVPKTMPWARLHESKARFSAVAPTSSTISISGATSSPMQTKPSKRRAQPEAEEFPSNKIYISEEKMAARMEGLHIDNNNTDWHPDLEDSWYSRTQSSGQQTLQEIDNRLVAVDDDLEEDAIDGTDSVSNVLPKLELSEELQLTMKTKDLLPSVLLNELNRPCMQIVLWKPPGGVINDKMKEMAASGLEEQDLMAIDKQSDEKSISQLGIMSSQQPESLGASTETMYDDDMDL